MGLKTLLARYARAGSAEIKENLKDWPESSHYNLPPNYSDWPTEWQKAYDNRITIMVSFWPDYPIEKIQEQADYWTRYYYLKKQGERGDNEQD